LNKQCLIPFLPHLRFVDLKSGNVVIPKSVNPARLAENAQVGEGGGGGVLYLGSVSWLEARIEVGFASGKTVG